MTDPAAVSPAVSCLRRARLVTRGLFSAVLITAVASALAPIACLTLFLTRHLYARVATLTAQAVLRLWGLRLVVHRDQPFPTGQVVYVSNHSSTIDLFVLVALSLPDTRYFNKGAFHLATSLRAPIVPLYLEIPPAIDPGRGYDAGPGIVRVHVKKQIDTTSWRLDDLVANTAAVRREFIRWHRERREADRARPVPGGTVVPAAAA